MQDKEQNIPLLDCPVDYLVGDASGKILNEYGRFPCKIKCGVYAYVLRGTATATINITKYAFHPNDIVVLEPGSFLLIHEFSEDALVYYLLFSSSFIAKNTFGVHSAMYLMDEKQPLLHVSEECGKVVKHSMDVLLEASNCTPPLLSSAKMVHIFNVIQLAYSERRQEQGFIIKPQDRKQEIFQMYSRLVLNHYHEWHHVARYAEELRLTLPHLCSTIKSVSGRTAGDLITDAILMDAKSQLKITNLQIKEIAIALGFDNVGFFNRFFKSHTGQTPKEYRNS